MSALIGILWVLGESYINVQNPNFVSRCGVWSVNILEIRSVETWTCVLLSTVWLTLIKFHCIFGLLNALGEINPNFISPKTYWWRLRLKFDEITWQLVFIVLIENFGFRVYYIFTFSREGMPKFKSARQTHSAIKIFDILS